jgi:hypothetical protein
MLSAQSPINALDAMSGPMVPLSYSNSCVYSEYFTSGNYLYASDTNSKIIGYGVTTTNVLRAKLHIVTFGIGTNAHFKLWTCEVFDPPQPPWKPSDGTIFIEPSTWITDP